ncbi:MAG TPA: hypothetical protein ENN22_00155 [bacterium]|nr:hypothetical protein [bacterium]HDP97583.1 hypothetical protein [bacterium]
MSRIQANFHLYAEDLPRAINFYRQNFGFEHLGDLDTKTALQWAALRVENAIIWLGKNGANVGLVLLVDQSLESIISNLRQNNVIFFLPEEVAAAPDTEIIVNTDWGKHAWFFDSEKNIVMLFEPATE